MPRRTPSGLKAILYIYLTPEAKKHAKKYGKKVHGSASHYINRLIIKDIDDSKKTRGGILLDMGV